MRKVLILLLGTIFFSCNRQANKPLPEGKKKNIPKLNKVVITGKTDTPNAFKAFNIMNSSYLFGRSHVDATKKVISDSLHIVLNNFEKPLFMEVATSGGNAFYRGWAYVTPGDSIHLKIKNGVMKFFGKTAILNNYWSEMDKATPDYGKNPYLGSLNLYKESVKSIYEQKVAFLNQYIKKHNIQSELFIKTAKSDLKHRYLFTLMNPKSVKSKTEGFYYSEIDGLKPIIQKEAYNNAEKILDLSDYFGKVSIEEFQDANNLNNGMFFKNNINAFIRYYFLNQEYLEYSKEKLIAEKEFIENNFEGELESYALAKMIRDYHLKGFGNSTANVNFLKNLINEYEDKFTKPSYIKFMDEVKRDLESNDFELRESSLNTKFINILGDTLTLKKIFARSDKRIKVVDFWATWCPPCVEQIKEGKPFKDRLLVENNVEWIYLSIESDHQKWLKKNKEFEHVLNFNNSFLILNAKKAALVKSLKVMTIPRYVIFNQKNKIVLNNAPSDNSYFERIINDIK